MKTYLILFALYLLACSCGGRSRADRAYVAGDTLTSRAGLITMVDCGGWTAVEIRAPWTDTVPLATYALIPREASEIDVPEEYTVVRTPLESVVVFSEVHTSAIDEFSALDVVKGVADGGFYPAEGRVACLIAQGSIKDVGSSLSPLAEVVVDLQPDAVLLSPYAGGSPTGLERTNIPLIWMADYLETEPLARAEWILLIGELLGKRDEASRLYSETVGNYNAIAATTAESTAKPTVIVEKPLSGTWYVPGGNSYVARMIADAGGNYAWKENGAAGSVTLDEAAVIDRGADADIWLIKDTAPLTAESLMKELPRARALRPFPENVYYCNTIETPYYNEIAFHPDRILADMAAILQPQLFPDYRPQFYKHL